MPALLLARHGEKEADAPTNWALRVTPAGALDIQRTAAALLAAGLRPSRILSSPFPRCVQTAALYAAALLPPSAPRLIAIEPGLCEVLTPQNGGRGLSAPPAWAPSDLAAIAAAAAPGTALDAAYAPIVPSGDLRLEQSPDHRDDVLARVRRVSAAIGAGAAAGGAASELVLYVSHGGPLRRFLDALCPLDAPFAEPDMSTALHIVDWRAVATFGPGARPPGSTDAASSDGGGAAAAATAATAAAPSAGGGGQ
jgi:broad specificity phosphatase PhoE